MTIPERAEYQTIWLGTPTTAAADGIYPVQGPIRVSRLGVFDRKLTIGDATKDSDDFISSWVVGDFSGGGQIELINEGSDTNRFWYSTAETRYVGKTSLPPLAEENAGPGGTATGQSYPIGDVDATFYAVFAGDKKFYGWNESTNTWYAAASATAMTAVPREKGTRFQGTGANLLTFVPFSGGYTTVRETSAGVLSVTNNAAGASVPDPITFCVHDLKLYAIEANGLLWYTTDGATWTKQKDEFGSSDLRLDRSQTPRRLEVFWDSAGETSLLAVTDQSAYFLNTTGRWEQTNLQFPPHPDFGLGTAVWRPGEDLWIACGMDCIRHTPANVVVPMVGPSRDDGVPAAFRGKITQLLPEASHLYALVTPTGVSASVTPSAIEDGYGDEAVYLPVYRYYSLMAYTGIGWHTVWAMDTANGAVSWACIQSVGADTDVEAYRLWIGLDNGRLVSIRLRRTFHNPKQGWIAGIDTFASEGFLETGRFDANMRGFDKLASHVSLFMDNATSTEKVDLYYRTDADPGYFWIGAATSDGENILTFDPDGDGFAEGVKFNWIQFRLQFSRSSTTTETPIMEHFVFHYTKIPQDTSSFIFEVPLPTETFMGRTSVKMADDLAALIESNVFCKFVHQGRTYRVRVAGVAGSDLTGDEGGGVRQVNLIEVAEDA